MQCITPIQVRNKTKDWAHQNLYSTVPCGSCVACLKRRAGHWSFRLNEEAKQSTSSAFLTLTYKTAPLSKNGRHTLVKKDFQNFLKRLRKLCPTNKIKYYACGEYGSKTRRPHYHAIILNLPQSLIQRPDKIESTWGHGHTMLTHSNQVTINYVVGYMTKGRFEPDSPTDDRIKEFSLMSKKMGMNYLTPKMISYYRDRYVACIVSRGGHIISMPRYYKQKIFTKEELKQINKEYLEINQMKFDSQWINSQHELSFKKQLIAKNKKEQLLKRQAI